MPAKKNKYKSRQVGGVLALLAVALGVILLNPNSYETIYIPKENADNSAASGNAEPLGASASNNQPLAIDVLETLEVKGRAPKTGYDREQFYKSWPSIDGCNLRQRIIKRDLGDTAVLADDNCTVLSGEFDEPYTGSHLIFYQKSDLTKGLQIDHVVALSDAWQKGAQNLTADERYALATDPLNLLAVDSKTNQGKSDGDAATWLPPNKKFRCAYVARQVSVKYKYHLWLTQAEKDMIAKILGSCPQEPVIGV
ncbi:HNH endonuclease [Candidatus Saccharibacteria bacterium]|nr:HNH endonuclease [Candidatus Saccharibacteria bacterium]MBR6122606.1 HNH endonuclease [Candidatus Saccharibacteria bacterium]